MDIQEMIEIMSSAGRNTRADYHLTLDRAIEFMRANRDAEGVEFGEGGGPVEPHSYRGYYSDLAFETGPTPTAEGFLKQLEEALGNTFEGYKGGDFVMDGDTPLWAASYGSCGLAVTDVRREGSKVILSTRAV